MDRKAKVRRLSRNYRQERQYHKELCAPLGGLDTQRKKKESSKERKKKLYRVDRCCRDR